jgi:hypothetical protein
MRNHFGSNIDPDKYDKILLMGDDNIFNLAILPVWMSPARAGNREVAIISK